MRDLVDHVDEQIAKGVDQLAGAEMAECGKQRHAERCWMATQLMNLLNRNATAIRLDEGRRQSGEQMAGHLKATQLFQLAKFLFHRFDTDRIGVARRSCNSTRPPSDLASKQERVHSLLHGSGQTIHKFKVSFRPYSARDEFDCPVT